MNTKGRMAARDLALIAVFAGVTAALGLLPAIYVPISPVPITAQTLGVMLAGSVLGARRGGLSQLLFLAIVAIGLPVLSGGRGGLAPFQSATVGFLVAFVVASTLIGFFTYRVGAPYSVWKGMVICVAFGMVLTYALGIGGMMIVAKMTFWKALVGNAPYLIGDSIKAIIAVLVAKGVHTAYPGLLPARQAAAPVDEAAAAPVVPEPTAVA
jgi:biotin transport system substrate-specific component